MLILSRRPGESLNIGDDIVVTVVSTSGNQVRLGIQAPREVCVLREEIYRAMQEENQAAAAAQDRRRALQDVVKRLRGKEREESSE